MGLREDIRDLDEDLDALYEEAEAIIAFVFPPMDAEKAEGKIWNKRAAYLVEDPDTGPSDEYGVPQDSTPTIILVEGPYFTSDAQVPDGEPNPSLPAGTFYYNVHFTVETPPPNQLAAMIVEIAREEARNNAHRGFTFEGGEYASLDRIIRTAFDDDAVLLVNPEQVERLAPIREKIQKLVNRRRALAQKLRQAKRNEDLRVDLIIVHGDENLSIESTPSTELPNADALAPAAAAAAAAASSSPSLWDLLDHWNIQNATHAQIILWEGDTYTVFSPSTDYGEFLKRIAASASNPPNLQIIESGHCHPHRPQKKKRSFPVSQADVANAVRLASIGTSYAIYKLQTGGMIIANNEDLIPYCGHVHMGRLDELQAAQIKTGRLCPRCVLSRHNAK